jgi:hypothetical protein
MNCILRLSWISCGHGPHKPLLQPGFNYLLSRPPSDDPGHTAAVSPPSFPPGQQEPINDLFSPKPLLIVGYLNKPTPAKSQVLRIIPRLLRLEQRVSLQRSSAPQNSVRQRVIQLCNLTVLRAGARVSNYWQSQGFYR